MLQFLLAISDESDHDKILYLFNKYEKHMLRFATSKFKNMGRWNYTLDAEDSVQSAFVKITAYIKNVDFSRGENDVKNYVFAILNNEIHNLVRDNAVFEEFDEEVYSELEYDITEELNIKQRYNEVVRAIENLDLKYSTTLFLFYCKEITVNEISDMMGISAKTVYTRLSRGKVLLLESLKGVTAYE